VLLACPTHEDRYKDIQQIVEWVISKKGLRHLPPVSQSYQQELEKAMNRGIPLYMPRKPKEIIHKRSGSQIMKKKIALR